MLDLQMYIWILFLVLVLYWYGNISILKMENSLFSPWFLNHLSKKKKNYGDENANKKSLLAFYFEMKRFLNNFQQKQIFIKDFVYFVGSREIKTQKLKQSWKELTLN